jgi:transcriptional regulator with XRE-family HTH domain
MEIYKIIGERIRTLRESLNLNQEDIADQIGMRRTSITNIEAGRQRLPIDTLYAIAGMLGVSVFDLLPENHPDKEVSEAFFNLREVEKQRQHLINKLKSKLGK